VREYEACFVIHPKVDEAGIERQIEAFSETVTSSKGEMVGVHKWGRRKLAYPVQKVRDGFYVLARFNGEADVLKEVDRKFKLNESILRHLVVRSAGDAFPPDLRAREPRRGMRGDGPPPRGRRRDEHDERPAAAAAPAAPAAAPAEETEEKPAEAPVAVETAPEAPGEATPAPAATEADTTEEKAE